MTSPQSDPQIELLRSIASSLKGIQSALDSLTGAVEGVAESIEKAHEPEGDLGHHLVGALKDISSALHKKAQMERSPQPQQYQERPRQHPPQQHHRRDDRAPLRLELRPPQEHSQQQHQEEQPSYTPQDESEHHVESDMDTAESKYNRAEAQRDYDNSDTENFDPSNGVSSPSPLSESIQPPRPRKPRPHRRRGAGRGSKLEAAPVHQTSEHTPNPQSEQSF